MTLAQVREVLSNNSFTRGLAEPYLAQLAGWMETVHLREGEVVFRAGEQSRYLFLVVAGSVCVEMRSPVFAICVEALGPGSAFGWSSLLDHRHTAFQVSAREQSTTLRVDAARLLELAHKDVAFGMELYRRLSILVAGRLLAAEARLADLCGVCGTVV